jgi:hypothetical protein
MKLEPEEFAEAAANFIGTARNKLQPLAKGDIRRAYFLGLVEKIEELTRDILILEERGRGTSSSILVRSLFDCMYCLIATATIPDFAIAKVIYEIKEDATRLKKRATYETGDDQDQSLKEAERLLQRADELRKSHHSTLAKGWGKFNSRECAEKANLLKHYYSHYSHFSRYTHTDLMSLTFTAIGIGQSGRLLHTSIVLLNCVECLPKIFPPKSLGGLKSDRDKLRAMFPQVRAMLLDASREEHARAREKVMGRSPSPQPSPPGEGAR